MTPVLTTDRLHLVAPTEKHVAAYTQFIASDRAAARGWTSMPHEAWRNYAAILGHQQLRGFGPYIAEARGNGRILGIFGPWWPEGQAEHEIKWTIFSASDEGRGFATEAAQACLADAFGRLGWTTAVSYISEDNERSAAVAKRLGAVQDGTWTTPRGTSVRVFRHQAPTGGVK
jgi:RimJ/RimL family protein N-acetyltransferase